MEELAGLDAAADGEEAGAGAEEAGTEETGGLVAGCVEAGGVGGAEVPC